MDSERLPHHAAAARLRPRAPARRNRLAPPRETTQGGRRALSEHPAVAQALERKARRSRTFCYYLRPLAHRSSFGRKCFTLRTRIPYVRSTSEYPFRTQRKKKEEK